MNRLKVIGLIFIVTGCWVTELFAQKTYLKGNVSDAKTGELLFGTNVYVKGTNYGAMSDFDGNFKIPIPAGTYTLTCSFLSYKTEQKSVVVKEGESTVCNFKLSSSDLVLEDVVVVKKRVQRTENAIVAMQKKSATLISGISSQEMGKAGASSAAGALKKVTGISVQGGKYVYVRGLSDRYTKTLLNGAEIPSLDPERNSMQMDIFPSNIIENMLVYKSFSADLPGDFTGGLIDIKTKSFPEEWTFSCSASLGFRPQSTFNSHVLSYKGGKYDFLGIDDGTRALPLLAQGDIPYRLQGKDAEINAISRSFNKIWMPTEQMGLPKQKYSLSLGNSGRILGKEVGYALAASFAHDSRYQGDKSYSRFEISDKNDQSLNIISGSDLYRQSKEDATWSVIASSGIKLKATDRISYTFLNAHKGLKQTSFMKYRDYKNTEGERRERRVLEFTSRNLMLNQLNGKHKIKSGRLSWLASYSKAIQDEPDSRFLINQISAKKAGQPEQYHIDPSTISTPRRFYRYMNEDVYHAQIQYQNKLHLWKRENPFDIGISNLYKHRIYEQKQINYYEANPQQYFSMEDWFADSNIDTDKGIRVQGSKKEDQKNSYSGYLSVMAAFAKFQLYPLPQLELTAGLRLEKVYMLTESYLESQSAGSAMGEFDALDLLPSLNVKYNISETNILRGAYSRTLARPSFREKSSIAIENKTGDIVIGNPQLQPSRIHNFDLRFEKYFDYGEQISLGLFFKQFKDPIERTFNTKAQNPELTWRNVDKAQLFGTEIEYGKQLDFIPYMKRFKLTCNFTYVYSRVKMDEAEYQIKKMFDANIKRDRVMFEQSPFIFNALLAYKNDALKLKANWTYTYNAKKLVLVNPKGIPDIYEKGSHEMNFNISKGIGSGFELKFQAKNILNNKSIRFYEYKETFYNYETSTWGREFSFSISYRF